MHATEPAPRIHDIPARLWTVIDTLLAKDPGDRYQSAADARDALERAIVDRPDPVAVAAPSAADDDAPPVSSTVLGWDSSKGIRTPVPGSRGTSQGKPRIATPVGIPKISIVPSSIHPDAAAVIASSATLPSDAIASELANRPELARPRAATNTPTAIRSPVPAALASAPAAPAFAASTPALAPDPLAAPLAAPPGRVGWKAIVAVAGAAIAAAVVAFVLVDGGGASSATPAVATPAPSPAISPTAPTPPAPTPTTPAAVPATPAAVPATPAAVPATPAAPVTAPAATSPAESPTKSPAESPAASPAMTVKRDDVVAPLATRKPKKAVAKPAKSGIAKDKAADKSPRPAKSGTAKDKAADKSPEPAKSDTAKDKAADKPFELRRPVKTNPGVM